jgi:anaerobic ribonucleoside-triphosphate reductase activating protein
MTKVYLGCVILSWFVGGKMAELNVALIIPKTEAEGPGERFAVWVQGCPMRCVGCCNPEFLAFSPRQLQRPKDLAAQAITAGVEGVSFLGGEPFAQAEGLAEVARLVRVQGLSVMVFTGYTLAELHEKRDAHIDGLLAATDLLVDGRYEQAQRTHARRWVGSENQVMHFLTDRYSPLDPRFSSSNTLELRMTASGITINGFPVNGAKTRL